MRPVPHPRAGSASRYVGETRAFPPCPAPMCWEPERVPGDLLCGRDTSFSALPCSGPAPGAHVLGAPRAVQPVGSHGLGSSHTGWVQVTRAGFSLREPERLALCSPLVHTGWVQVGGKGPPESRVTCRACLRARPGSHFAADSRPSFQVFLLPPYAPRGTALARSRVGPALLGMPRA
jgi:hypothetical protein